ncbi:glycosyl transferase family 1 [Bacillus sp. MBGLi97]|nr:glycosyl transferase family 1 [Bacillus sp. MBGLi97]
MKKILVLNHFPIVNPPISGGTLRYYHLYKELSNYYDVTLLSQTSKNKSTTYRHSSNFTEYKVQKDSLYKKVNQKLKISEANYERELIINMKLTTHSTIYSKLYENLYKNCDIIIHESPYLLEYDRYIGLDNKHRIYNSHNHEYVLAKKIWKNKDARRYLPYIYNLEKKLVKHSDLIFVTSENERLSIRNMYNKDPQKIKLAPNGIIPSQWLPKKEEVYTEKTFALFIGSDYPPNINAVDFIIQNLADKCCNIEFLIAGRCCNPFFTVKKPNIKLLGHISHWQKLKLFAFADIAINPIFTGAGINLKTLEFLSAGIPLFSSGFGVRGLNLTNKRHYIHAEQEDFSEKINQFCSDKLFLSEMSSRAQKYINEKFTWCNIAKSIQRDIEEIVSKGM